MRFYDQQNVLILKNSKPFYGDVEYVYNANRGEGTRKGICRINDVKVPVYQATPNSVWIVENLTPKKPKSPIKKISTSRMLDSAYTRAFTG